MTTETTRPADATADVCPALLPSIQGPGDVRQLPADQLPRLAAEIRAFLVEKVTATGGHLGPNLGAVELTVALHRVFNSPFDPVLFDIGHQAYVHKLLTGRAPGFDRLRKRGGLAGYLQRHESPHDWIENSHASTALSYAGGLAKALTLRGETARRVVAVIGDGALTGGLALEGLNNLGTSGRPVIAVLNDNNRSYAPTTGGLAAHLAELRESADAESATRTAGSDGTAPPDGTTGTAGNAETNGNAETAGTVDRNVFNHLGLAYVGPVDGHDITALETALTEARDLDQPVVVHVVTVKGKGYAPAEADQDDCMHAIGPYQPPGKTPGPPAGRSWTSVFGDELCALAEERPDIVALTAAMPGPTGLAEFARRFPDRAFDVGIAEQHAVTSAAGLAMGGRHPVVAVYATFLSRAFDQVLMDVSLHRQPVTFVLDRAGITGPDGPSHHGMWDLSLLSMVPGLRMAAPRDALRLRELLREATEISDGPAALRLPKATTGPDVMQVTRTEGVDVLHHGHGSGPRILLVSIGATARAAVDAAEELARQDLGITVVDPRWASPVNPALVSMAGQHDLVVTVEDGLRVGGVGTLIAQSCVDAGIAAPVINLGLPRAFIPHGVRSEILADVGLDAAGIARGVRTALDSHGITRHGHHHDHAYDDGRSAGHGNGSANGAGHSRLAGHGSRT